MKLRFVLSLLLAMSASSVAKCRPLENADPLWSALDQRYKIIELATFQKDAKLLFSVYSPTFEAHQFNGQVWKFDQSAAYSTSAFGRVQTNLSMSNTILNLRLCGADTLMATVLQQWSRKQIVSGKERLFQTTTVQDETWVRIQDKWLRKLVENERPGAWLVDLKRIDPYRPFDPDAPEFDPHDTKPKS